MDRVEPTRKLKRRLPRISTEKWDRLKEVIREEYKTKTLEELITFLKVVHDFSVTKRQLVYRLGIWEVPKYAVWNQKGSDLSESVPEIESHDLNDEAQDEFEPANLYPLDHTDVETYLRATSSTSHRLADESSDATNYYTFTRLLIQYICESMGSGSVFVDLADHISRGHRLFNWAAKTDEVINFIRASHSYGTLVPLPFKNHLETLDALVVDEHPHLLGTLFVIWKNTSLIDDDKVSERYFINTVNKLCQKLLGRQHLITGIFACISIGSLEPIACLERLEVLPSELFAPKNLAPDPSFEKYETSDYHTMSSLYAASAKSLTHTKGLDLMNSDTVSLRALALRQRSDQRHEWYSEQGPLAYPWETSLSAGQGLANVEEPFTKVLTGARPPQSLMMRPVGMDSLPPPIDKGSQSSMRSPNVSRAEDSWPLRKPEASSESFSEHTGQPQESHPGKTQEETDTSNSSITRTRSTSTPTDADNQTDVDGCSVSHDEESGIWSSSTADEQQNMRALETERGRIVQEVMDAFLNDLDSYLEDITSTFLAIKGEDRNEPTQAPSGAEGSTKGEQGQKPRKQQKLCGKGGNCGGRKGKGLADDRDEDNESAEDGDGSERRHKVPNMRDGPKVIPLACPYFKWNPLGCPRKKECAGPGWPSVHRVKEHLYRRHGSPFECPRCRRDLKAQSALNSHLKLAQICEVNNEIHLSGRFNFGPDIERRLRVRCSSKQTEAEKWKQVYRTLFDVREDEIPTPYYDHDFSAIGREETWKEFTRREIMIFLRQRIEAEVERRFAAMAPELIAGLRDIVHDLELVLRENFEKSREQDRTIDREEALVRPPPPLVVGESSTNTAQTLGNDGRETAMVSGIVPSADNNLAENLPPDDSQQGFHSLDGRE
ncbi:uncharacterized protein CCOS01_10926 [Colletotrichum costaricense]|uniref:Clr5 domain-containing protein n=1 Tax=Colletotrichum costaricense TaxID=1209916 RepID=A0AAI9YS51_9PEZI|nr:uncharacterized protein CCOS01_10926 [Colletotrichum costaricense]KAK1520807.1 hypothetical protein CCOS01_10926 [Colletotrichum costaricense]